MKKTWQYVAFACVIVFLTVTVSPDAYSQNIQPDRHYRVVDGVIREIVRDTTSMADTTGLAVDSLGNSIGDSVAKPLTETATLKKVDTNPLDVDTANMATKSELRAQRKLERRDTSYVRYSKLFRDTIPLSRMTAISIVAPGFSQLYNKQAWKMPILYATAGAAAYFGFKQNSKYVSYKKEYDAMQRRNASREEIDPVHRQMIKYNNNRTLLLAGAIVSYAYFLGDGVVNYNGNATDIKKATTLSTIFPGAGQIYNRSAWKVPIIYGTLATMAYIIDFNSRGYKRTKLAYDIETDGNPETTHEFQGIYGEEQLRNLKNNYRRNRDLCIILTAGVYLLNIIEAHVDAHFKDYDISDDLAVTVEPSITQFYTMRAQNTTALGLSLKLRF